ncbi:hypothetical protein A7A76_02825 [Lysobacter enzymogenes]|uniref:hypothetical protein n=1 Tax=Lysobacter enzymogenes TaxID=69 RepID=UPI0019D2CB42|nr:hypothetical protein [Lysobacter enzymogenes]MBN7138017.1 hypothetical protein [Lysobacter enzymogenes]
MLRFLTSLPFLFSIYTVMSVGGMVLVKHTFPAFKLAYAQQGLFNLPALQLAAGASMYVFSFLTWMVILSRAPLIVAYPIAVGLTMAASAACAIFILGEQLTWSSGVGVALIFAGVMLLTKAA